MVYRSLKWTIWTVLSSIGNGLKFHRKFLRAAYFVLFYLDCKTVRIFAYSSTREQSNKRSGMRLKTESENGERRSHTPYGRVRLARVRLLRHALPISLLILRKKPTVLQSKPIGDRGFLYFAALKFLFPSLLI